MLVDVFDLIIGLVFYFSFLIYLNISILRPIGLCSK